MILFFLSAPTSFVVVGRGVYESNIQPSAAVRNMYENTTGCSSTRMWCCCRFRG